MRAKSLLGLSEIMVLKTTIKLHITKPSHLESRVDSESSQTPEKLLEVVEHGNYAVPYFDDFISLSSDLSSSLLISLCYFGFCSPQWYLMKHYVSLLFKVDVYVSFSRMF